MKSLIYITAYAKTEDKRNILRECIKSCKKLNMDILISSHAPLPEDIIQMVDYYVYDADNRFNNGSQHILWRSHNNVTAYKFLKYSYEFTIIKLIRNALYLAKANGYDLVLGTDFDNIFSDEDIEKLKSLKQQMIDEDKDFIFFHPEHAYWILDGEPLYGIYYDLYVTCAKLDKFFDTFDSYFPKTIEEYNKTMAYVDKNKPQCLEYYFYDAFKHKKRNAIIINQYIKEYLSSSQINISNIESHREVILLIPDDKGNNYLYTENTNKAPRTFKIRIGDVEAEHTLSDNTESFRVIKLTNDCTIEVAVYDNGTLIDTTVLEYQQDRHHEYQLNGRIEFSENR